SDEGDRGPGIRRHPIKGDGLERDIPGRLNPPHMRRTCCTAAKRADDVNVTSVRPMKVVDQAKMALCIVLIGPNKVTL
ncbi:MAG TPA: hypothetical protein VG271_14750, partial [Beijerinckiaceae bacterium]|nr:hypothetical protein [Beijerinckiaceae bacterium]